MINPVRYIHLNQWLHLCAIQIVSKIDSLHKRIRLYKYLSLSLWFHATDIYSSSKIEQAFLELAVQHEESLPSEVYPNSTLHVLTSSYLTGGHTRCVERWMNLSEKNEIHACVLLHQDGPIPQRLYEECNKHNGRIYRFDDSLSLLDSALHLRKIASEYTRVILYTHPHDPTPLVAFGTNSFKRPVIYFNHANHVFWLGASISDIVAEINNDGLQLCKKYRTAKCFNLGIPPEDDINLLAFKTPTEPIITIPSNNHVILASGDNNKFESLGEPSFQSVIESILSIDTNIIFIVIGIHLTSPNWKRIKRKFQERLILLEPIAYQEYLQYLAIADIVIDSYPTGGGSAILDAIKCNKPILCLDPILQSDFITHSACRCKDITELTEKCKKICFDADYKQEHIKNVFDAFKSVNSKEAWLIRKANLLSLLPKLHKVDILEGEGFSQKCQPHTIRFIRWIEPQAGSITSFIRLTLNICSFLIRFLTASNSPERRD